MVVKLSPPRPKDDNQKLTPSENPFNWEKSLDETKRIETKDFGMTDGTMKSLVLNDRAPLAWRSVSVWYVDGSLIKA